MFPHDPGRTMSRKAEAEFGALARGGAVMAQTAKWRLAAMLAVPVLALGALAAVSAFMKLMDAN